MFHMCRLKVTYMYMYIRVRVLSRGSGENVATWRVRMVTGWMVMRGE